MLDKYNSIPTPIALLLVVWVVLDENGNKVQETEYFAFGLAIPKTIGSNKYKFLGREIIAKTGWVDLMKRMYDPPTGRFISVDPSPDVEGQESLSTYQYGYNNPLRYPDRMEIARNAKNMKKHFGVA